MRLLLTATLTLGLATTAFAVESSIKTLKVERGLSPAGQRCIECHAEKQPGIVADWKESRHGHVGVSCIDCHGVDQGSPIASQSCPGVKGTDIYMSVMVTPNTCARCHSQEVKQFSASGHFRASLQYHDPEGRNYEGMKKLMQAHEGQGIEKFKDAADMT
ncbi:MAG: beta-ketoacyl-ACP synthase, partial [Proteobacteria bacterium]